MSERGVQEIIVVGLVLSTENERLTDQSHLYCSLINGRNVYDSMSYIFCSMKRGISISGQRGSGWVASCLEQLGKYPVKHGTKINNTPSRLVKNFVKKTNQFIQIVSIVRYWIIDIEYNKNRDMEGD